MKISTNNKFTFWCFLIAQSLAAAWAFYTLFVMMGWSGLAIVPVLVFAYARVEFKP